MVEVIVTVAFRVWYEDLAQSVQASVYSAVTQLEEKGVSLGFPQCSDILGSRYPLRELRIQSGGRPIRVFYAFDPKRQAVLLLGADKTGRKRFYEEMIAEGRGSLRRVPAGESMKTVRFADLKHKMSPARRAEIARAAKAELRLEDEAYQMSLRAVREMAGKTQAEVATAMKMGQGHVSMFETRDDRRVSNLRRYIKALGGELKLVARFGKKEVRLDV